MASTKIKSVKKTIFKNSKINKFVYIHAFHTLKLDVTSKLFQLSENSENYHIKSHCYVIIAVMSRHWLSYHMQKYFLYTSEKKANYMPHIWCSTFFCIISIK